MKRRTFFERIMSLPLLLTSQISMGKVRETYDKSLTLQVSPYGWTCIDHQNGKKFTNPADCLAENFSLDVFCNYNSPLTDSHEVTLFFTRKNTPLLSSALNLESTVTVTSNHFTFHSDGIILYNPLIIGTQQ